MLGITKAEVNDLIKGRRNITARLAVRIGTAFGTSADIWLKLQNRFDIFLVEKNRKEEKQIEMIRTRKNELAYA
ncbi:hypothetical protein FACS1894176_11620 [Bacteroidia bacterium]|nr:hypothetical protein FACS189428_2410 [Clostridia bacterium]GHV29014.1 hypothetical protein FACS1894176_11620 [Bacteroidia bacterium]